MAKPPIPSASTWWNTKTSAVLLSVRPLTSVADHNGRDPGNRRVTNSVASSNIVCSSPGGGQIMLRRCLAMSNSASSTQIGRPHPKGVRTSR